MISGDLDYVVKERLQEIRQEIGDVGRMLKAMIKSLENKYRVEDPVYFRGEPLNPCRRSRVFERGTLYPY